VEQAGCREGEPEHVRGGDDPRRPRADLATAVEREQDVRRDGEHDRHREERHDRLAEPVGEDDQCDEEQDDRRGGVVEAVDHGDEVRRRVQVDSRLDERDPRDDGRAEADDHAVADDPADGVLVAEPIQREQAADQGDAEEDGEDGRRDVAGRRVAEGGGEDPRRQGERREQAAVEHHVLVDLTAADDGRGGEQSCGDDQRRSRKAWHDERDQREHEPGRGSGAARRPAGGSLVVGCHNARARAHGQVRVPERNLQHKG
jgi:hypothetical protein